MRFKRGLQIIYCLDNRIDGRGIRLVYIQRDHFEEGKGEYRCLERLPLLSPASCLSSPCTLSASGTCRLLGSSCNSKKPSGIRVGSRFWWILRNAE